MCFIGETLWINIMAVSPLWGNCSAYLKEKLQGFQNRAGRIISGANYEINSADALESLGWQTLEERRKRDKSILMYRILNNRATPILNEQFTRSGDLPENYNPGSRRTDLILPNPKRDYLKKSFKYSGAKLWNSLSTEAKLATSEYAFLTSINR